MNRTATIFTATFLVGLLGACASHSAADRDAESDRTARAEPTGHLAQLRGDWTLVVLRGQHIQPQLRDVGIERMPTMSVDELGRLSGYSGVNRWNASIDIEGVQRGEFEPTQAAATKMAGHETAMRIENMFFDALTRAARFDTGRLSDGVLVVQMEDGEPLMRFERSR